jgi:hypothetical protein
MARITLSPQWRRALEMLVDAGETGVPASTLLASGFSSEMLQSLEMVGLAARFAPQREPMAPMHITNAGRLVLGPRNAPVSTPGAATPRDCAAVQEETATRTVGFPDETTRA